MRNPGARTPELKTAQPSDDEVVITYASPRKLCAIAKGIVKGVAKHYGEEVEVAEAGCMHRGDASCTILGDAREARGPVGSGRRGLVLDVLPDLEESKPAGEGKERPPAPANLHCDDGRRRRL